MTTLRAASRLEYEQQDANPTNDQLKIGALQRIADATELMARRYDELLRDRDYWKRRAADEGAARKRTENRCIALRGVITKMKKAQEASQ